MQVTDKMQLLSHALQRNPEAHRKPDAVKRLAEVLGLQHRAKAVRLTVGEAALQHGALQSSQQICLELIEQDFKPAWRLCHRVMRRCLKGDGSLDTQRRLLSYAMQHAPAERVSAVLSGAVPSHSTPSAYCAAV